MQDSLDADESGSEGLRKAVRARTRGLLSQETDPGNTQDSLYPAESGSERIGNTSSQEQNSIKEHVVARSMSLEGEYPKEEQVVERSMPERGDNFIARSWKDVIEEARRSSQ